MTTLILVGLAAAVVAWLIIPSKNGGNEPSLANSIASAVYVPSRSPRYEADSEKLRALETAMREKLDRKFRNEVLAEAKDLIEQDE